MRHTSHLAQGIDHKGKMVEYRISRAAAAWEVEGPGPAFSSWSREAAAQYVREGMRRAGIFRVRWTPPLQKRRKAE